MKIEYAIQRLQKLIDTITEDDIMKKCYMTSVKVEVDDLAAIKEAVYRLTDLYES